MSSAGERDRARYIENMRLIEVGAKVARMGACERNAQGLDGRAPAARRLRSMAHAAARQAAASSIRRHLSLRPGSDAVRAAVRSSAASAARVDGRPHNEGADMKHPFRWLDRTGAMQLPAFTLVLSQDEFDACIKSLGFRPGEFGTWCKSDAQVQHLVAKGERHCIVSLSEHGSRHPARLPRYSCMRRSTSGKNIARASEKGTRAARCKPTVFSGSASSYFSSMTAGCVGEMAMPDQIPPTWTTLSEDHLRRVADIFGEHGAAAQALRRGAELEADGLKVAYFKTPTSIVALGCEDHSHG